MARQCDIAKGLFALIAQDDSPSGEAIMVKQSLIWVLAAAAVGTLAFFALAHRAEIQPVEPPAAASFSAELIARGEVLAAAGNCESCHTTKDGQHFAGGLGIGTPFGTIFTSNITPDPANGIGRWSGRAFARALHEGVARDGTHLYPAFPFDHFTRVTDDDVQALYAYLMTRPPANSVPPANTVPFPMDIRALQWGWKLLFFHPGVYRPDPAKSEAWNRGAYLSEGLAHCGACHSPRNGLGASKTGSYAYTGSTVDGWVAPALTAANTAPLPWTEEELYSFLRTGGTALHGVAAASMSEVIHIGLAKLPDADIKAIATYFADLNGADTANGDGPRGAGKGDERFGSRYTRRERAGCQPVPGGLRFLPLQQWVFAPCHPTGAGTEQRTHGRGAHESCAGDVAWYRSKGRGGRVIHARLLPI